jgi:hypothetical protein
MSGVTWLGLKEFQDLLADEREDMPKDLGRALRREGETIMTRSQRDYVPVDLGTLRASGTVEGPEVAGTKLTVTLGYGGAASAYALVQHEAMHFNHPRGGGPKYLERPVNAAAAGMAKRLASYL